MLINASDTQIVILQLYIYFPHLEARLTVPQALNSKNLPIYKYKLLAMPS